MAPVPQWEADPLRVMRNRTASASPNRRLARLSICFPIFISAPPPLQHSGGWVSVNTRKKVTFYLNDRPAIHPPLHNPRSWRASRYQGRVLFTNPEYFFHRGCSHRRSLICAEKLREEEGRAWLIWAMRSGRRIRNDRAMAQQAAWYGRIEGRRRAKE